MVSNPQASSEEAMDSGGKRPGGPGYGGGTGSTAAAAVASPETDPSAALRRRAWAGSLAIFALSSALLLWTFRLEIGAAVALWSTSETYGYAFFVLPIVLFLIARKRALLAQMMPAAAPWGLVLAAGLTVLWMLADIANIMVVQQLAVVGLWQTLFLTVLGWRITRTVLFPLAYLVMAVPMGSEIIPQLQTITAQQVIHLLRATGMPVFLDGYYIQIPSGSFLVAEACSGLHFLIVCIALGLLIAHLFFRSWPKRVLFVALSVVVPIIANGLRAYGIIMLAHLSDYRLAADVDHIVYGFLFLSIVILVLIGIASMMRDSAPAAEGRAPAAAALGTPAARPRRFRFAAQAGCAAVALALVLLGQGWTMMVKAAPVKPIPIELQGPSAPGWTTLDGAPLAWTAAFAAPDATLALDYRDGNAQVDLQAAYYVFQREGAEALSELNTQLVGRGDWRRVAEKQLTVQVGGVSLPLTEMLIKDGDDSRLVWYWYRIGGSPTNSRIMGKILEMKATLLGQQRSAFVIAISTPMVEEGREASATLQRFLEAAPYGTAGLVRVEHVELTGTSSTGQ